MLAFLILPVSAAHAGEDFVPGEVIVAFERDSSGFERGEARDEVGAEVIEPLRLARTQLVEVEGGVAPRAAARALERQPGVRYAHPNYIEETLVSAHELEPSGMPNDPVNPQIWALENTGQVIDGVNGFPDVDIDAPGGWAVRSSSPNVVIGIVDSGVGSPSPGVGHHVDQQNDIFTNPGDPPGGGDQDGNGLVNDTNGYDFRDGDNNPADFNGHGTHVTGIAAARGGDGLGRTGVTQQGAILPVRVMSANGTGTTADITDGLDYAGEMGAFVVNVSLGGNHPRPGPAALKAAIDAHPNTLYIAASGNDGDDIDAIAQPTYPCAFRSANLICVGSIGNTGARAASSNFGPTSVDLFAPGVDILSDFPMGTPLFSTDFSAGIAGWTKTQNAGTNTWNPDGGGIGDSPGGNYATGPLDISIESPSIDLTSTTLGCQVRYLVKSNLENGDELVVRAQGISPFAEVDRLNALNNTGSSFIRRTSAPLFGAGSSNSKIRFSLETDGDLLVADGVEIRSPEVRCGSETAIVNASGTSQAAPHVVGAAALFKAQNPGATPAQAKAAILNGVQTRSSYSGQVASGGRLNIAGMFDRLAPSPPPDPVSPAQNAALETLSPTFEWQASSDAGSGLWRYALIVDGELNRFVPAGTKRAEPAVPLSPGSHKWFVAAVDKVGNVTFSTVQRTVTVSEATPEPTPSTTPTTPDDVSVNFDLDAKGKQKVARLQVTIGCGPEACDAELGGKAVAKRARRSVLAAKKQKFPVKPASLAVTAGETATHRVKFKKHKKSLKALRRALERKAFRKKTRATINVTVTDASGNSSSGRTTIKLKR